MDDKVRTPGDVVKVMLHGIRFTGRPGPKCSQPSESTYMHDKLSTASIVVNTQGICKNQIQQSWALISLLRCLQHHISYHPEPRVKQQQLRLDARHGFRRQDLSGVTTVY